MNTLYVLRKVRAILLTLLCLIGTSETYGSDVFDGTYLSIPMVSVGSTTYANVVITVNGVVSVAMGTPTGNFDVFDSNTGQLFIPSVQVHGTTYTNVRILVGVVESVGGVALTAYFVDAPIKGVQYAATPSGLSGTTDVSGSYNYQAGDTVAFSIPNAAASAIQLGSTTPPTASSVGGNVTTFVLSLPNGNQIAQVTQALNHSTSPNTLDVSGLSLNSTNAANLNNYISSGGNILPNGANPSVTTNVTTALQTAQVAATYTGGATATTPVTSTFLNTVNTNLATAISNFPAPTLSVPLATLIPGRLAFFTGYTTGNPKPSYNIHYNNPNGSANYFTSGSPAPSNTANYPNTTWSVPTSPINRLIVNYASNTVGTKTYPGYTQTITVSYDDAYVTLATYNLVQSTATPGTAAGTVTFTGSAAGVTLDTTFSQTFVAGKTLTLNTTAGGSCPLGQVHLVFNSTGTSASVVCAGSTTAFATFTFSAVSGVPGLIAMNDNQGDPINYFGLVKGSTLANGRIAMVQAATTATSNDGSGEIMSFTGH